MSEDKDQNHNRQRLQNIVSNDKTRSTVNTSYTKFISTMKMALPLIAIILTVIVFVWSSTDDLSHVTSDEEQKSATRTIGKNELIAPNFESIDDKNQPFTISAKRAIQGETNDNLVILEEPVGTIKLNNGSTITIRADQGAYRQDNRRLLLKGHVQLNHDKGYELVTEQLHIDLNNNKIWSEHPVSGQGPAGAISASGLTGDIETGVLNFEGRARLLIDDLAKSNNALEALQE